jgi:hypothetical protein
MPVLKTMQVASLNNQGFYDWQLVFPEDGALVSNRVGDAPLIFVLFRTLLYLVGVKIVDFETEGC